MNQQPNRDPQWPEDAWRLHLRLDMPALESGVVEYAVFSADPFPQFASDKQRVGNVFQKQLEDAKEPARRETLERMQLVSLWKRLFRMVRGDEVHALRNGYSAWHTCPIPQPARGGWLPNPCWQARHPFTGACRLKSSLARTPA